jgi:hypothetical protein
MKSNVKKWLDVLLMSAFKLTPVTLGVIFGVVLVASFLFISPVKAAITPQLNYQGKLLDLSSAPVADGNYTITTKLYTGATGGVAIWTESQSVTVTDGIFSILLGGTSTLSVVDFNQSLYLGVQINADTEMTPRKVIGSVPTAFTSDKLDNLDSTDFISTSTTAAPKLATLAGLLNIGSSSATTTFLGNLAVAGNSVISGLFTSYATVTAPVFVSTSTATSTFAGGLAITGGCLSVDGSCLTGGTSTFSNLNFTNATGTNATTSNFATTNLTATGTTGLQILTYANATGTNIFNTTASSTNLYSTNADFGTLLFGNATGTNIFTTTASSTNLYATNFNTGAATIGNATATNFFSTTASSTNSNTTNLSAALAIIGNSTTSAATSTDLYATYATFGNLTLTGATSLSDLVFTYATGSSAVIGTSSVGTLERHHHRQPRECHGREQYHYQCHRNQQLRWHGFSD